MGIWQKLFGPRERPEDTRRLTRGVMDLLGEGKSDEEVRRVQGRRAANR